jgi:hypothetical protein
MELTPNARKIIGQHCMISEEEMKENKKMMLRELRMIRYHHGGFNDAWLFPETHIFEQMKFFMQGNLKGDFHQYDQLKRTNALFRTWLMFRYSSFIKRPERFDHDETSLYEVEVREEEEEEEEIEEIEVEEEEDEEEKTQSEIDDDVYCEEYEDDEKDQLSHLHFFFPAP